MKNLAAPNMSIDAGYGFELVRLSALEVSHFEMEQTDLAGEASDNGEALALFADRIRARLGEQAVLRPVRVESHIPERAVVMRPLSDTTIQKSDARNRGRGEPERVGPERPIRLFRQPEPIDVSATEVPEGPPLHFRWRRVTHRVARAEGPERIAPEWWHGNQETPTRDYFRIEDASGRRYWLYRQGLYDTAQEAPQWFMHGIFA